MTVGANGLRSALGHWRLWLVVLGMIVNAAATAGAVTALVSWRLESAEASIQEMRREMRTLQSSMNVLMVQQAQASSERDNILERLRSVELEQRRTWRAIER